MFEIRKLVFLEHVDYEGINNILQMLMTTAYLKYITQEKGQKYTRKRKRGQVQENVLEQMEEDIVLDKPFFVSLPVKPLCDLLDVKAEVIVTILSKGEEYAKKKGVEYYRFHNMLPEVCNIRFYKYL